MAEMKPEVSFPGGSKSRVNRAGDKIRQDAATEDDFRAVEDWRAAHRGVLNTFQEILRRRTREMGVTVAQRHKRKTTIFDKLLRLPKMNLSRMDDIAGCRLIFKTIPELYNFRKDFHTARFDHRRVNEVDKYDYIKSTKGTGYRGVHDVYEYHVRSEVGRALAGLLVEIQYRTHVQHAWATAEEVIGFVTESQPKFQKGDKRYENAMALAAEILARASEKRSGPFPKLADREVVRRFLAVDSELGLLAMLKGLNAAKKDVSTNRNAILIFSKDNNLETQTFRDATDALRALFQLEKDRPGSDIVLVRADTSEEVRFAFKNYFTDARDFIRLLESGCEKLSGIRVAKRVNR
ncbi:MAG: RelA/SpoT domain-containing protein [Elusimicrobiota bacterium]